MDTRSASAGVLCLGLLAAASSVAYPDFALGGNLSQERFTEGAILLPSGELLLVGGSTGTDSLSSVERYNPLTGQTRLAASLPMPVNIPSMFRLLDGSIAAIGGLDDGVVVASIEFYDPIADTWALGSSMQVPRFYGTTTLLNDGRVLSAGGVATSSGVATVEIYDPKTHAWTMAAPMLTPRGSHTATLLRSGKVLVVGGNGPSVLNLAEIYDPSTNTWTATAPLAMARQDHSATLMADGRVLVTGGIFALSLGDTEIFDPASETWSPGPALNHTRFQQVATLMPNGWVMVFGGLFIDFGSNGFVTTAEYYVPGESVWHTVSPDLLPRDAPTVAVAPNGRVYVTGGNNAPIAHQMEVSSPLILAASSVSDPSLQSAREDHTATLLPNGSVLIAGGFDGTNPLASAELYVPSTRSVRTTAPMSRARTDHTATLLPSGRILVVGGESGASSTTAEDFDATTEAWSTAGSFTDGRGRHTATLLGDGRVLVVGGTSGGSPLGTAFVFDPLSRSWSAAGSLATPRAGHTATLLPGGDVLVAGGLTTGGIELATTERFNPVSGAWTVDAPLTRSVSDHCATVLDTGEVLLFGGSQTIAQLLTSSGWTPAPADSSNRARGVGLRGASGEPVVLGGGGIGFTVGALTDYDLLTGQTWSLPLAGIGRWRHSGVVLEDGSLLMIGGNDGTTPTSDVIRVPLPQAPQLIPTITGISKLRANRAVTVLGSGFRFNGASSTGNIFGTFTDFPIALLDPPGGSQRIPLAVTSYNDSTFSAQVPASVPPGYYRFQVSVNGVISSRLALLQPNQDPVASNVEATTSIDTPVPVVLQGSDADDPTASLRFSNVTQPASGTLSGSAPNLVYTPAPGFRGTDSWTYLVSDPDTDSSPATVTVIVTQAPAHLAVGCACETSVHGPSLLGLWPWLALIAVALARRNSL